MLYNIKRAENIYIFVIYPKQQYNIDSNALKYGLRAYAPRMGISASETVTYCRKITYPRTNSKIQS